MTKRREDAQKRDERQVKLDPMEWEDAGAAKDPASKETPQPRQGQVTPSDDPQKQ